MKSSKILFKIGILLLLCISPILIASAATYTYDDLGRLTSVSYTNGQRINYTYDAGGNLLTVTTPDTVAPTVYSTDPANGATGVAVNKIVYVTFSEEVQPGPNYGNILMKTGATVAATTYSLSGSLLTIDPVDNLNSSTTYAVYIPAGAVKDLSGHNLVNEYILTFTTQSILSVVYTDPLDGAIDVPVDKTVYVTFNKDVQPGENSGGITVKSGETVISTTYSVYGSVLTIDPVEDLNYSTAYAVYVPAGAVKDLAGNDLAGEYTFGFTTSGEPDVTPPTVSADPPGGLYNAAQSVTLTASEPATIYYTTDGSDPTTASAQYTGPIALTVDTTLKFMAVDLADNQSVIYTETYTIDTAAPTVSGTDPADGSIDVPVDQTVYVTFSENIAAGDNISGVSITGATTVSYTYSVSNNVLTLDPVSNLDYSTAYAVYVPAGAVKDPAGNGLASQYIFGFTTTDQLDTTPPTVSITSPSYGSTVCSDALWIITANATDDVGVTRVEFYVNNQLIGEDSVAPYTCQWKTKVGTHHLWAKAYDAAGNAGISSKVTVKAQKCWVYPAL